ncbi:class I SAM-dependent methyltransferase [Roseovarius sp. EL26]|uniref:class I SAM-dependent methyltransferase n=1 Tax=Roseovarius sp. EL26 TaxID=2126672 RepID=UPI000EA10F95|nr:class I SAM-dependent methyltransferase [Roseovarius sp. EL26]
MQTASFSSVDRSSAGVSLWADFPGDWRVGPVAQRPFQVYWDQSHAFGQLLPRPALEDIPDFYNVDNYYTHGQTAEHSANPKQSLGSKIIHRLSCKFDHSAHTDIDWWQNLLGPSPRDFLEIGCGGGGKLERVQSLGHNCIGVEPDVNAIAETSRRGLNVLEGTAENLPNSLKPGQFDCIFMHHVLEHCLDPALAIQNCRKLLRPGGMLVVEVPNNECAGRAFYGAAWLWLDVPRHLNFFTHKSLAAIASTNGFDAPRIEYAGYSRQFGSGWFKEQDGIAELFNLPKRSGFLARAMYLLKTAFTHDKHKYDSVRIIASAPHETA